MTSKPVHVVTGAFGYSGRYIAERLLERDVEVRTLTGSPDRASTFGDRVRAEAFHFDQPEKLTESLRGVSVLYNTYWVRFNHKTFTHAQAVENTKTLFRAAREAGVERVVHVSITNPSKDAATEYFRGKAELEEALIESGLSYAILRPAILFGGNDILINNIAWMLRHLPAFGVCGDGEYRVQPIHVEDFAELAVRQGAARENVIVNAIGPETFTFIDMARQIRQIIGCRRPIISVPPSVGYWSARMLGPLLGDVILTREEITGLMSGYLHVDAPPAGKTKLTDWATEHADTLGRRYASELARRQ